MLEAKEKGHLSISQKQAIIKLTEKKEGDKRFIKKLETHFFVKCRSKNNIKSSFGETKKSFTRFNIFTTNGVC